jgi:hypothetical protein
VWRGSPRPDLDRLVTAFERIFGATIFFGTDTLGRTAKVVQRSRFNFFSEAQIWYSRDPEQYPVSDQFENVIVLSDEFYREIVAHLIPADLEAVKVLAGSPAVLDLFMWLSYRCFLAKGKERIPLFGACGLVGRGFSRTNVFQMRQFFLVYREIVQTPSGQLGHADKLPTPSGQSASLPNFPLSWSHYVRLLSVQREDARSFL